MAGAKGISEVGLILARNVEQIKLKISESQIRASATHIV